MTQAMSPLAGQVEEVSPGVRRILAPNPSPFTGPGTNTFLLGERQVAVIDPGPENAVHMNAILGALGPEQRISHILVTHAHLDHSPLARSLSDVTGAPVHGFGDARAGRSEVMEHLANVSDIGGGEGVDEAFQPDVLVKDEELIESEDWQIRALWTPGHFGNHLCFDWQGTIFTGDLVMGWSTSLVSPPDGDLTQFMASCRRLRALPARIYLPGHGPAIHEPHERLDWLLQHRLRREEALLLELGHGAATPRALAERVYTDIEPQLMPAAERNVLAHLIDLTSRKRISPEGDLHARALFRLI